MPNNPYLPPGVADDSREARKMSSFSAAIGLFVSLGLLAVYLMLAGISVFEWSSTHDQRFTTDYVRTLFASVLFCGLSTTAAAYFYFRSRKGLIALLLAFTLLAIFVYPGLNVVWNFFADLIT